MSDTFLDSAIRPLRGLIGPIFDKYRQKDTKNSSMTIPAWAVSEIQNTPIPYTVENQYDFGFGGVYGPPDMPVRAGIVGTPKTIAVQYVSNGFNRELGKDTSYNQETGFTKEPPQNVEYFVYSPFTLPTDLPCSTVMNKY